MLVKVKGIADDGKEDWLYIGEVEELQVSGIITYSDEESAQDSTVEDDYWMFTSGLFNKENSYRYIRIACTKHDGHMVSVVFNTVAYICNDSGKTIEKHVVNEV